MEVKPDPSAPAAVIKQCRSGGSDNEVIGDSSNTRPAKKVKVELPLPISAMPLAAFCPLPYANQRLRSPMIVKAPTVVQVPRVPPLLTPQIPALGRVAPSSLAPKINAAAVRPECNNNKAQNIPTVGRVAPPSLAPTKGKTATMGAECNSHRQFWKAGDYEGAPSGGGGNWESYAGGSDHIRVHPRFLHSNATSHRWVLGAFAELLDNSLDEVRNGATFVNIDMIKNKKNGDRMLIIEDNGGGMDPIKMRQCMSLGYSAKSKMANTIGQYGNGFKTSTMRLGADVIVFSRFRGEDGNRSTQSIGLLSYTFLRCTRKEDIEVPMLDYEREGQVWERIVRPTSSAADWNAKVDTIVKWSPFSSEADLLGQFNDIKDHGTRIFIYNLWEDDQGELELDFDADPYDIQIRGVNRDEKSIQMAQQYPNSRHFLTYRHSLRSYASILYLRIPPEFRVILRGKEVEHHNIVNDMMMSQKVTYRPQHSPDGVTKDSKMVADVTVGFVKDAKAHIDVQGFNVYHKNRLIKPFWRVWHPPGSDGRGVIGVLEANFVEPAHDKQGFERTLVLSRLEAKLAQMQRTYWSSHCHEIGYAPRQMKKSNNDRDQPNSQAPNPEKSSTLNGLNPVSGNTVSWPSKSVYKTQDGQIENPDVEISIRASNENNGLSNTQNDHGNLHSQKSSLSQKVTQEDSYKTLRPSPAITSRSGSDDDKPIIKDNNQRNVHSHMPLPSKILLGKYATPSIHSFPNRRDTVEEKNGGKPAEIITNVGSKSDEIAQGSPRSIEKLAEENRLLRERLKTKEREFLGDLLNDLQQEKNKCKSLETELDQERKRCKSLETQLQEAITEIQELNKLQDTMMDIFAEEKKRYENEEDELRKELKKYALSGIQELHDKERRKK